MSCPDENAKSKIGGEGGTAPLTNDATTHLSGAVRRLRSGETLTPADLDALGGTSKGRTAVLEAIKKGKFKPTVEQVIALGDFRDSTGCPLSHFVASMRRTFTVAEIKSLGDPRHGADGRRPLSHACVLADALFTADDIQELRNPRDREGMTLAHVQCQAGDRGVWMTGAETMRVPLPTEDAQYLRSGDRDEWLVATEVRDGSEAPIDILIRRPDLMMHFGAG
jgi:hypothetical protein